MNSSEPDSAAVFACAQSLWEAVEGEAARNSIVSLAKDYNGFDQFMREIMRIGKLFEDWACEHVEFAEFTEVWPYYLVGNFGEACLSVVFASHLASFEEEDCLRVALHLKLPVMVQDGLPVPVDLKAANPVLGSAFVAFRIQSLRLRRDDVVPFVANDEPFDDECGPLFFGLYGIEAHGRSEHIADRSTYRDMLNLVQKLAPCVEFPKSPTLLDSLRCPTSSPRGSAVR